MTLKNLSYGVLLCFLLAGCATRPDYYEAAYQTLAAVDAAQTVQIGRNPRCYQETNPVIAPDGRPQLGRTVAYFALAGTIHYEISSWLNREVDSTDDDGWRTARFIWRWASLGFESYTVANNFRQGITPFGTRLDEKRDGCLGIFP